MVGKIDTGIEDESGLCDTFHERSLVALVLSRRQAIFGKLGASHFKLLRDFDRGSLISQLY